jgi:2-dehydro-3-deoxyphosphogluconate aldolase/(4S)-4-hydroxy-2-oxoglutarate aldolase
MTEVIEALVRLGLVPVVKVENTQQALGMAQALLDAGLPCAELTFCTAAAEDCIRTIAHAYLQVIPGAGIVLTAEQAERAVRGGARYIVSPGFDVRVVDWCLARQVPVMPGVATPTEILMALDNDIVLLEFFPAEALAAASGGVRFVPTGGVTADNLPNCQKLASVSAVGGTWLVLGKLLAAGAFAEVTRLAREAVETMARERAHGGGQ